MVDLLRTRVIRVRRGPLCCPHVFERGLLRVCVRHCRAPHHLGDFARTSSRESLPCSSCRLQSWSRREASATGGGKRCMGERYAGPHPHFCPRTPLCRQTRSAGDTLKECLSAWDASTKPSVAPAMAPPSPLHFETIYATPPATRTPLRPVVGSSTSSRVSRFSRRSRVPHAMATGAAL